MKKTISLILSLIMMLTMFAGVDFSAYADDEYIEIWNVDDLYQVRYDLGANYILMTDIDMTEETSAGGEFDFFGNGWNPIGSENIYATNKTFTGTFDGNNHSIIGMNIDVDTLPTDTVSVNLGLFSNNEGVIKNLNIVDCNIHSSSTNDTSRVGAIAAINTGLIENCHSSGYIFGTQSYYNEDGGSLDCYTGGIVGSNIGRITLCSNSATLQTYYKGYYDHSIYYEHSNVNGYCAGIAGSNCGLVDRCYNVGDIYSEELGDRAAGLAAGIVGNNKNGTVENCYNSGKILCDPKSNGYENRGGYSFGIACVYEFAVWGNAEGSTVKNCYNNGVLSCRGYKISIGGEATNCYYLTGQGKEHAGAVALSDGLMKKSYSFEGFDFEDVWVIDENSIIEYPQLINNRQDARTIENVELYEIPAKTTYYKDEFLVTDGGKLKITYQNGSFEFVDIDENMVSGFDVSIAGTKTLTISYKNYTFNYDINVKSRPSIDSVELISAPLQTTFVKGTTIDYAGAVVQVNYSNGDIEQINLDERYVTGGDIDTIGVQSITYTIGDYTLSFDIEIVPVQVIGIEIVSLPNKTVYYRGEQFDSTGLVVNAYYNTGGKSVINDYDISGFGESIDENTLTVSHSGFSESFNVIVHQPEFAWTTIKEASCTVDGKRIKYCTGCGEIACEEIISAIGHTKIIDIAIDATCQTSGLTEGAHCQACGAVIVPQQVVNASGHSYESQVTTPATCTSKGVKTYTCSTCNSSYQEEIDMIAHVEIVDSALESSCTTTGLTEGAHCQTCGAVIVPQQVVSAKGHSYESQVTTPATCTSKGIKTYTCSTCNSSYQEEIDFAAHTEVTDPAVPATCQTTGLTKGSHCSACGAIITAQETIKVANHAYDTVVTQPTCANKGYTKYTCLDCGDWYIDNYTSVTDSHSYVSAITTPATCTTTGVKTYTCSICGDSYTEPIAMITHTEVIDTAVNPTCTTTGLTQGSHCSACGTVIVAQETLRMVDHDYDTVVTQPTCANKGYTKYTCSDCGDWYIDNYTSVTDSHSYVSAITTPATCTTTGVKTYTCSICGDSYTEPITMIAHTEVIDTAVNPTCDTTGLTQGSHCSTCGEIITYQQIINAKGHNYNTTVIAPTCTTGGYTVHTCSVCGNSYNDNVVANLTHHYDSVVTPATCTNDGYTTYICAYCSNVYVDNIVNATGHTYVENIVSPTCTTKGYTEYNCSNCDSSYRDNISAKTPHEYGDGVVTTEPTYDSTGVMTYTCNNCDDFYTEDIPKLVRVDINKWVLDENGWYYLDENGEKLTNQWMNDSLGWCYLGADGYMLTNTWIQDSQGWCYIGSEGYCLKNCWMKDSIGWVYIGAEGRMLTNSWVRDSVGWCYVGEDGYAVTNCWKQDSYGWCYLNDEGSMTKNQWVYTDNNWYYLDSTGYRVSGTYYINGVANYFDSNGIWLGQ